MPIGRILSAAAAGALAACTPSTPSTPASSGTKPRPVRFAVAQPYTARDAAVFPGRVRAERRPSLSFRIPGRLTQVLVDVGDEVKEGAPIAFLDPSDFRTRVADATAAVAQAEANAARTKRTAERAERLFKGNAVSEAERDQTRDLAKSAQALLESARQRLELARRELAYTRLVAPESGVVVERRSDPGANVQAGQAIIRLSGDGLEIRTDVPESVLADVQNGGSTEVRIAALGGGFRSGKVIRVAKGAIGQGVLYPVFVRLDEREPRLVPGMAAEVKFVNVDTTAGALLAVPPSAVVGDPDGAFVWVLEDADSTSDQKVWTAHRRSITVARLNGRSALVAEGLKSGERVATAGASYLSEGQRVRPARLAPVVFQGVHTPAPVPVPEVGESEEQP